jgi:hypothetical protein
LSTGTATSDGQERPAPAIADCRLPETPKLRFTPHRIAGPSSRPQLLVRAHGRHAPAVALAAPDTGTLTTAMRIIIIRGVLRFITKQHAHFNHPSQPVATLASSQPNN